MISLDNLKTTINAIKCLLTDYPKKKDIPTKLPNPNSLTFTGAATRSYDGSEALAVEIPRVPKPLTYDYMPEGYPSKAMETVTPIAEEFLPDNLATKSDVAVVRNTAENAQTTANAAQTTANAAQTTANDAKTAANDAKTAANDAKTAAENAKIEPISYNYCASLLSKHGEFVGWYETMPMLRYDETLGSFCRSVFESTPLKYEDMPFSHFICDDYFRFGGPNKHYILFLTRLDISGRWGARGFAIDEQGGTFSVESAIVDKSTGEGLFLELSPQNYMLINSSTPGSTKKFKIAVDDSGTISATEVTA